MLIHLLHQELPGSRYLLWTIGTFTTHHRRDPRIEASDKYYGTTIVPGLVQRLSAFRTHLCTHGSTAEQKNAENREDLFWETRRDRTTCPTNNATEGNHLTRNGSSEMNTHLHSEHLHQWSTNWLHSSTVTTQRTRYPDRILVEIPQRLGTRLRQYAQRLSHLGLVFLLRPYLEDAWLKIWTTNELLH